MPGSRGPCASSRASVSPPPISTATWGAGTFSDRAAAATRRRFFRAMEAVDLAPRVALVTHEGAGFPWAHELARALQLLGGIHRRATVGAYTVFWDFAPPSGGIREIPPASIALRVSSSPEHAPLAIDRHIVTTWKSREAQRPDIRVEATLDRPRPLTKILMDPGNQVRDYPRGLRVETSLDGVELAGARGGGPTPRRDRLARRPSEAEHQGTGRRLARPGRDPPRPDHPDRGRRERAVDDRRALSLRGGPDPVPPEPAQLRGGRRVGGRPGSAPGRRGRDGLQHRRGPRLLRPAPLGRSPDRHAARPPRRARSAERADRPRGGGRTRSSSPPSRRSWRRTSAPTGSPWSRTGSPAACCTWRPGGRRRSRSTGPTAGSSAWRCRPTSADGPSAIIPAMSLGWSALAVRLVDALSR